MGLLDFLKHKELTEIALLKKDLQISNEKIIQLESLCNSLSKYETILDIEKEKECLEEEKKSLKSKIDSLNNKLKKLANTIKEKQAQIVELDETILLQDFGVYSPIYDFANSNQYKERLDSIKIEQKKLILFEGAATCSTDWTINGSKSQGRIMTNQNIKQILRCFNDECDMLISKVKFNNITAFIEKMKKSYDSLNRINSKNGVSISEEYLNLRIEELQLAYEYARKKQEEKEEQKRIREQMREEMKLQKEIDEARRDIEKEQRHYTNALSKLNKQMESCDDIEKEILIERKIEIEHHLEHLNKAIKDIDYREANKRAGYVYVISNIGSFGENIYKIGMTRRLDPMERVDELGDASVPFKFDVHAMIFSDDAPSLETALHHAFENKKVNIINPRREFFHVTLDEIEAVVKDNYDRTVEFIRIPNAEQYRESQKIINQLNKPMSDN